MEGKKAGIWWFPENFKSQDRTKVGFLLGFDQVTNRSGLGQCRYDPGPIQFRSWGLRSGLGSVIGGPLEGKLLLFDWARASYA